MTIVLQPASLRSGAAQPDIRAARANTRGEALLGYVLIGPALTLLIALFILPIVTVFLIALTNWQLGASRLSIVGFSNFITLLGDDAFRAALVNSMTYVLIVVPITTLGGLALALLIESGRSLRAFYRAVHFLPYMATLAAMSIAWEALLHPTIGLVNQVLTALQLPTANWLQDERTVLPALAMIGIWQNLGFAVVMFLSGLKAIPSDLYDAADVDGADGIYDRLRVVILPLLGPVTMFVVIVMALRAFQSFDAVRILTQGGPANASEMLLHLLYRESFEFMRVGQGAAIAVIFLAIVAALTLVQASTMDRRVHYS